MRLLIGRWIATASLAAFIAAGVGTASANQPAAESVRVGSLPGAYLAARMAESDNDLEAATAYYRRALAFDPDNQTLQQSMLLGLIALGRFDEALPFADKLQEVPEVERFSRLALGVDAIRDKRFTDAEHWLKLSLESDLDRLITGLMTAWAKLGGGDGKAALAHIDNLSGPEWYGLFVGYHRALIAEQAGETETAGKAFDEIVSNVASGGAAPDAYLRAVEAYAGFQARQGEAAAALETLEAAEEFAAGRVTIQALREEIEAGDKTPLLVPDAVAGSAEALLNLATALNRSGGESFVRLYLQYATALQPNSDAILIQLAGIAEQQGDAEAAIAHYEQIPQSSPMKRIAELQLGLNLADLKRPDEAIEHLKTALQEDLDDTRAYLALGGVYSQQENYRAAADLYDQAVSRIYEPTRADWNIFYQRGIAYERLKDWPKAEPNFRKALELFPDQPHVLNYLGYSWVDRNINLDEGLDLIQRAVDLRPNDGYIVDSLGWVFYRLDRFDDAVRELERAVGLMPHDPILNDHLGDAYWRVGRLREAVFQWQHARGLEPEPELLADIERKLREGLKNEQKASAGDEVVVADMSGGTSPAAASEPDTVDVAELAQPPAAPRPLEHGAHVVLPGESLWSISAERLGEGARYPEILNLNPQLRGNPDLIRPGQSLTLPGPAD